MSRRSQLLRTGAVLVAAGSLASFASFATGAPPPTSPPTQFEAQPGSVNFGAVPVNGASVKTVKLLNRTKQTFIYKGADWPNFGNPSGWLYPYGFWSISGDAENYPCYEIAPRSYCVLTFQFKPYAAGSFGTTFTPRYGPDGGATYSDPVSMRGTGILMPSLP